MAVLLSVWCDSQYVSMSMSWELSTLLRVKNLSVAFRQFVLTQLDWFEAPSDVNLHVVSLCMSMGEACSVLQALDAPPAWLAPCRSGVLPDDAATFCRSTFIHSWARSDAVSMVERALESGVSKRSSFRQIYFCGYDWRLTMELVMPERTISINIKAVNSMCFLPKLEGVQATYSLSHVRQDGS